MKWKTHQQVIAVLNIHAQRTRAPKFINITLLQLRSYIDPHTPIMGGFNTLLSPKAETKERNSVSKWYHQSNTDTPHLSDSRVRFVVIKYENQTWKSWPVIFSDSWRLHSVLGTVHTDVELQPDTGDWVSATRISEHPSLSLLTSYFLSLYTVTYGKCCDHCFGQLHHGAS